MAVRFDGTSNYTAADGIPAGNAYTLLFWLNLASVGGFSGLTYWTNGSEATWFELDTDAPGLFSDTSNSSLGYDTSLSLDTWYRIALVRDGASTTLYIGGETGALTPTTGDAPAPDAPTEFWIAAADGDNGLDGRMAGLKAWTAALTPTELAEEFAWEDPVRTADLLRAHPWRVAETTDHSGNGHALDTVGTPTTEQSPDGLAEGGPGAGTVDGVGLVQLGALAVTATGRREVRGLGSVQLGGLAVTAAGRREVRGLGAVQLGGLSITGHGIGPAVSGQGLVQLGGLTVTARGTLTDAPGVPLLRHQLGGAASLVVEVAWGANLTADPAGWTWSDITTDVRMDPGVSTRLGRGDEASAAQPASCTFTLDNSSGDYSLGGRSQHWPHVRQGTPVRVSVNLGDGWGARVLFQGYADGWSPGWDTTGRIATVEVQSSGVLRRLAQGDSPVQSTMRRVLSTADGVLAYWPCEDGQAATGIASAVGGDPISFSERLHGGWNPGADVAAPDFAASDIFNCSLPLPKLAGAELYGTVPDYTATGTLYVQCLLDLPEDGSTDQTVLLGLVATGSAMLWEVRYLTGGNLNFRAWGAAGLLLDQNVTFGIDGERGLLGLTLVQTDADTIHWEGHWLREGSRFSAFYGLDLHGHTLGKAVRVQLNTDGGNDEVTVGHIALFDAPPGQFAFADQLVAYAGEMATGDGRLARLCDENGLDLTLFGAIENVDGVADQMGPQLPGALLPLLRDVEAVDRGTLFDGVGPGLAYVTKRRRESRTADLVLDAAAGDVGVPFVPVHDDQTRRNKVTASRPDGSSATHEDTDGELGTRVVGLYDDSLDIPTDEDAVLPYYAGWLVHQGTVEGYRWPSLVLDLVATPQHVQAWTDLVLGDRIDVLNVHTVASAAPDETLSLAVEGYQQTITPYSWNVTVNCSPYRVWAVARAAATTGDVDEHAMRADTDGSTVSTAAAAGATSLVVATPSGPRWTTRADDFPLALNVGGVRVVATACTGTSSTQTFTVQPLPIARAAGLPVSVWAPPALGL